MYVTKRLWEIPFHHVPVRAVLCMHHQMYLCIQYVSYLGQGNAVWAPVLLPLSNLEKLYGVWGSSHILPVGKLALLVVLLF